MFKKSKAILFILIFLIVSFDLFALDTMFYLRWRKSNPSYSEVGFTEYQNSERAISEKGHRT